MSSHLQLLGTASADSYCPPSALLFFDQTRYLFGSGEGTQRLCTESHVRMSKIRHVFITRLQQDMVGGLTGLLITLADLGLKRVGVHGPGPLQHFLQASRNVSVRSGMKVDCYEATPTNDAATTEATTAPAVPTTASTSSVDAGCTSPGVPFTDVNISVEVVVLAEHNVSLPPLRVPHMPWYPKPAVTAKPATEPVAPAPSVVAEPIDASIDDTPVAVAAVAPSTDSIDAVEPACKKAKHSHEAPPCTGSVAASCPVESAAAPAAVPAASVAASPSAPLKLSYSSVNQSRESERQAAEWVSSVHPSLVAYIVTLASTPGKFDIAKAKALGIPPGPLYAKLKAGESVTMRASELHTAGQGAKNKRPQKQQKKKADAPAPAEPTPAPAADDPILTFHPSDCVGAVVPGPKFAFVDCPNAAFIDNIVQNAAFRPYQTSGAATASSTASRLSVVLHLAPLAILSDARYSAWMDSFGPSTQHVLLNSSTSIMKPVFKSAALNYLKMQRWVNPDVFPARVPAEISDDMATPLPADKPESNTNEIRAVIDSFPESLRSRLVGGANLLRYHLLSGRKDVAGLDATQVLQPIRDDELQQSLIDSSNPTGVEKLNQWRTAMRDGRAQGKGVMQIAEELKQKDAAADANSVPDASAIVLDTDLTSPRPLADFTPVPDVLAQLASQSDAVSPHMLFLGTGSAIPSKYRNVTGQFFHPGYTTDAPTTHPIGGFFFDCGEGSYGQLCLRYAGASGGPDAAQKLVNNLIADLKAVWISHIHADHHLGLLSILSAYKQTWLQRYKDANPAASDFAQMRLVSPITFAAPDAEVGSSHLVPKLMVVGPRRLFFWLKEYAACAFQVGEEDVVTPPVVGATPQTIFDWIEFVTCSELMDREGPLTAFLAANAPATASRYPTVHPRSLTVFQMVQVRHCNDAYGLVVETRAEPFTNVSDSTASASTLPPYKMVISGDTQPCQALVDAGVGATLLVHEATLEDDMIHEAREKRHSTTRQAIEVGITMGADRILLTHFSQRYPKIPTYSDHFSSRTCIAFDLMCVRFNQLTWLPALTPAFAWMFDEQKLSVYEGGKEANQDE